MALEPLTRERLSKLQGELEALRPESKAFVAEEHSSAKVGAESQALEELRQDFKRKKFLFLSVEAQLTFLNSTLQGQQHSLEEVAKSTGLEQAKLQTKERSQALKRDVSRELEEHARLQQQAAEAARQRARQYEECQGLMREMQQLVEEEEASEGEAAPMEELLPEGGAIEEAAAKFLGEADELGKRRRLEYEERCLQRQRREPEEARGELAAREAQELRQVERLEALEQFACDLGLPRLHIQEGRGCVLLGGPPREHEPYEELSKRMIRVAHDAKGTLTMAQPHRSLALEDEAKSCVEDDDLPRLVTLVWHRMCAQQVRLHPEALELGGA